MREDSQIMLDLRHWPARLKIEEIAPLLGFSVEELVVLMKVGLLKALASPKRNSIKYFCVEYIVRLRGNEDWLRRATAAVYRHWGNKNRNRNNRHNNKQDQSGDLPLAA